MKKILSSIILSTLLMCSITITQASEVADLEAQISDITRLKSICHQLAECARSLGCDEDHLVIQFAQDKWDEVHKLQQQYESEKQQIEYQIHVPDVTWSGPVLTKSKGINWGPQGKETYYNLPMQGVVRIMRNAGYDADSYPYWVRDDGCKMLGPFIMLATNQKHWPLGSLVETSRGWGIACDTGTFIYDTTNGWDWIDIAVTW